MIDDDTDAPVEPEPDPPPAEPPSSRSLSRYVTYYCREIRPHPRSETRGVIRQIQRLLEKGTTLEMIETALRNYKNDPFRQQSDPRLRKHMRTFFTEQNVKAWQTPVRTARIKPVEPAIDRLGRLE